MVIGFVPDISNRRDEVGQGKAGEGVHIPHVDFEYEGLDEGVHRILSSTLVVHALELFLEVRSNFRTKNMTDTYSLAS